ncbi:dual-specificity RNA methyltransferase RlmN-like protein, partial [Trifolium pratense]
RPGQAIMLWKRMYGNNIWAHHTDELEGLNKDFKKMLSENADFMALAVKEIHAASDGTRKILFTLDDGMVIETVVIPCDRGRTTVMGLKRHLTAAEIVEQAVFARRLFTSEVGSITNVVFMGMGEPLHNIDNVIKAADIMVDDQGLHFSPRKVTVSTSGLVPQLRRYLQESNCAIAVSLNATTDEVRNWIMPINRKYKLDLLLETLREELSFKHKYKVLFEYVMLEGINDRIGRREIVRNSVIKIAIQIIESGRSLHVLASRIVLEIIGEGDQRRFVVSNRKNMGTPFVLILDDREDEYLTQVGLRDVVEKTRPG